MTLRYHHQRVFSTGMWWDFEQIEPGLYRRAYMAEATFDTFVREVRELLEPTAAGKGYNVTGADGPNELYDFVHGLVGGPGHALGEIVYKVRRYAAKHDPKDLLKIAAWAFLVWRKATVAGLPVQVATPGGSDDSERLPRV